MVAELTVRRWTRGQHDRLYVNTAAGVQVGWRDLRTGQDHVVLSDLRAEFAVAVDAWQGTHPPRVPRPRPPADDSVGRPDVPPASASNAPLEREPASRRPPARPRTAPRDLAEHQAGANLAARAERLQIQNPALRRLARVLGVRSRDQPWRQGALGEIAVGKRLDRLRRRGARVLHSIVLGAGGDVDHLVICRHGVFSINTKHHRRAIVTVTSKGIRVQRRNRAYPEAARREAQRVTAALSTALGHPSPAHPAPGHSAPEHPTPGHPAPGLPVHVTPLVVVHGQARLNGWIRHRPLGVQVLPSWVVTWWFRSPGRTVLSPEDIDRVYAAARRPEVWRHV
ncbi:nuclease-related domain-containing protein [Cryptosporangium sp. NPDC051539]|uniref:nuclease-related domain-containing protein n=1 Tax=Cryptosporangium sp. NPDC051539 TaxID=3363962 RepID=UPI0037AE52D0